MAKSSNKPNRPSNETTSPGAAETPAAGTPAAETPAAGTSPAGTTAPGTTAARPPASGAAPAGPAETGATGARPEATKETEATEATGAAKATPPAGGQTTSQTTSTATSQATSQPAGKSTEPASQARSRPQEKPVDAAALGALAEGRHGDPHSILGAHPHDGGVTIRAMKPLARTVTVVYGDQRNPLEHEAYGIWVGVIEDPHVPDYRLEVTYGDGVGHVVDDPYRFLPTVGEMDLHLINEGRHEDLWTVLGSHVRRYEGPFGAVTGTSFAVWAPHAQAVRLKGDFNSWDGREHPMRQMGVSGVWELFVPEVGVGAKYKYDVRGADGHWRDKADPMAVRTEEPPATASVVFESGYEWADEEWLQGRAEGYVGDKPMSVYEVHLGSWRRGRSYRDLAHELVDYVRDHGFTHIELLPVMEHPFGGSWGYQVTSYFAPTARFGDPDDLRYFVDKCHQAGIGVILDWVPAHFPKDAFALARFDGTPLYEDPNPLRGEHPDWGTYVFNFGRKEVRNFLVANALYWLEEFHADGLRVDAVASMLYLDYGRNEGQWSPNMYGGRENLEAVQFLQEMTATCRKRVPGVVTIAEESTSWPGVTRETHLGGLGFDLKWNMGWMHDTLEYMAHEPVHRSYHHGQMTFSMVYAYSERYVLPLSHDEVVHGKGSLIRKMPGDRWQQLANLRAYLAFMWAHPGKQLLFMGCEFAQDAEWAESRELDWWLLDSPWHRGLQHLVGDLNSVYRDTPALYATDNDPSCFGWIDANDSSNNVLSFFRSDHKGSMVVCVVSFAGVPHHNYRIGFPMAGRWSEVVNTDAEAYAGSGVGNLGGVTAVDEPSHGLPASASLSVPPLGAVYFRWDG